MTVAEFILPPNILSPITLNKNTIENTNRKYITKNFYKL